MIAKAFFAPLLFAPALLALPDGFEINTFAEPFDAEYPTALSASPEGVVYLSSDQNGSLDKKSQRGSVVTCTDTDGDGVADKFVKFIPDVDSPRGGHIVGDTFYLLHPPFLTSYRDTTGDGVADEKKVLVEGFSYDLTYPRGADHTTNAARMGIDGWIYVAVGDFGMPEAKGADGKVVTLHGGGVARVRPDGSELEIYSYHTRNICDVAISPYLDLFTRDNTNDGKGWNIRVHHFTNGADHGYPRLYKNFKEEAVKPLLDMGGGSGTGALYLHEPGFPEGFGDTLYTCDWTTGDIFRHPIEPVEATYKAGQEVFMKLGRAIDMDVDGQSTIYVADWRGGKFTFAGKGKKVGLVQRIVPKGSTPEKWPDLKKSSDAELLNHLVHRSGVRRLEAQREILTRGATDVFASGLLAQIKDGKQPRYGRVAAIFTYKQLFGAEANQGLAECLGDDEIREFVLRALADRSSELEGVSAEMLEKALADENPRVRLQAVIGLRRLKAESAAPALIKLAAATWDPQGLGKGELQIIPHHCVQALVEIGAWEACLLAVEDPKSRAPALRALQMMHERGVVDGLLADLGGAGNDNALRFDVMGALARLYHREGKWDLKSWWGTRPDDRGPYFNVETWEETERIQKALEAAFPLLPESDHTRMLELFARNRMDVSKLKLGKLDPVMIALGMSSPNKGQLALLSNAARDPKRPWSSRVECFRAVSRSEEKSVLRSQIEVLSKWLNEEGRGADAEQEISEFINAPALILKLKELTQLARRENDEMSRIAWRAILTFAHSPLIKERFRANAMKTTKEDPREVGFFLALVDLKLPGYQKQIAAAIGSDNDELIASAKRAGEILSKVAATSGVKVAEMDPADVAKLAMEKKGDAELGKELFTRVACVTCHAVDPKAIQKGPYLGSAGSKFTRDYLIESILNPAAVVSQGFQTFVLTGNNGKAHTGFITNEQDGQVELRDIAGTVTKLKADEIKSRQQLNISMMPPALASGLTADEFVSLVEYLVSLKE